MNTDQLDFIKAFNKLTEEEKAELKATLTEEESAAIQKIQDEYER